MGGALKLAEAAVTSGGQDHTMLQVGQPAKGAGQGQGPADTAAAADTPRDDEPELASTTTDDWFSSSPDKLSKPQDGAGKDWWEPSEERGFVAMPELGSSIKGFDFGGKLAACRAGGARGFTPHANNGARTPAPPRDYRALPVSFNCVQLGCPAARDTLADVPWLCPAPPAPRRRHGRPIYVQHQEPCGSNHDKHSRDHRKAHL